MAAASNNNDDRVKIHEVINVTPFSSSDSDSDSTTSFTLPLTYLDIFWLKLPPVERLFFYKINTTNWNSFNSLILQKLNHSLSLTLLHYLPLAGHVMWPQDTSKPALYYFPDQNDGVSVTLAEYATTNDDYNYDHFNYLTGNGIREAVEFHPLIPQLSISDDKAEPIAIQITLFPNRGFSIGISTHHAVLDGKSSTMFFKSWAYLCKQLHNPASDSELPPELTPRFDRSVVDDPKGLDVVYARHWAEFTNSRSLKLITLNDERQSNLVRMTFELTREHDMKKLRDKIVRNTSNVEADQLHLSTHVLTCAHVFTCLVKAKGEEADNTIIFGVTADLRNRLDPPIPVDYFGNCVGGNGTAAKASELMGDNGVVFVAEKLSGLIKGLKGDVVEGSEEKFVKVLAMMMKKESEEEEQQAARFISVAGSTRFDVYGCDFGWGKPIKVEVVSIDRTGAVSLTESGDGRGGVEVGVVLEKHEMDVFASLFVAGLKS